MAKASNYGDLPRDCCGAEDSKIVIVPAPYDRTSTWVKGADKGPAAIIEASANMELYDIETDSEVYQHGIFTDRPIRVNLPVERMVNAVRRRVLGHVDKDKFVVVLGGEHSVSIGSVEAHNKKYDDLTVLQLDAHADLRDEYQGSRYNHACVMARIKELCPMVQVGVRSMDISEKNAEDRRQNAERRTQNAEHRTQNTERRTQNAEGRRRVFFAEDIHDSKAWIEKVARKLTRNVYVTIDLDVFDPSVMPSTGTPEPGGLLWYDVLGLLKRACAARNVIGFDVVELCPNENNKAPDFLAAKLIYKLLSYKFEG